MLCDADRQAILDLEARWLAAETGGRPERVADLLTDDCTLLTPDGTSVQGREAFIAGMRGPFPIEAIELSGVEIHGGTHNAWKSARFTTRFDNAGAPVIIHGHHVWILRKTSAGWRVAALSYEIDE